MNAIFFFSRGTDPMMKRLNHIYVTKKPKPIRVI